MQSLRSCKAISSGMLPSTVPKTPGRAINKSSRAFSIPIPREVHTCDFVREDYLGQLTSGIGVVGTERAYLTSPCRNITAVLATSVIQLFNPLDYWHAIINLM